MSLSRENLKRDGEDIEFEKENLLMRSVTNKFDMGTSTLSAAYELESWEYTQHKAYHLQVVKKIETESKRATIPATIYKRLSYFRCYTTSSSKTHYICLRHVQYNRFFWHVIVNMLFKSLPSVFIHFFLSSYSPEQHLFLSKMLPIAHGCSWQNVICGFMGLLVNTDMLILLLDYFVCGLLYKNPWNRCPQNTLFADEKNKTYYCYTQADFTKKYIEGESKFLNNYYETPDGELFQMAPMIYFRTRKKMLYELYHSYYGILFILIWVAAAILHSLLFKKCIWVLLDKAHWALNFIHLATLFHLVYSVLEGDLKNITRTERDVTALVWKTDTTMLAESITAPPLVHLITARSCKRIKPGSDTLLLVASNTLYILLRGAVFYTLRAYCESLLHASIKATVFNSFPWFYFWPIYLSTFVLGEIYTITFFAVAFTVEFFTFIITYQCLIEVVVCEWPKLKRWMVAVLLTIPAVAMIFITTYRIRNCLYTYGTSLTTLTEILVISYCYPLGRLFDDLTFHYGNAPSLIIIWSIKLLPVYYVIKCYTTISGYLEVGLLSYSVYNMWLWVYIMLPLVLGVVYAVVKYLVIQKQNWKMLFMPRKDWGPRDHLTRQLRKQFDSRLYVGSQASRFLSRHIMSKAEAESYKLDINYNLGTRRMTVEKDSEERKAENDTDDKNP